MKTLCLILIFLGLSIIGIEAINDFSKTKVFYASLNPEKNYSKDILVVNEKIPPSNSGSNKTSWVFYGYCKSDKLKSGITIPINIIESGSLNTSQIPIWRINTVKDKILYRRQNNVINSPFSYEMRQYWATPLFMIAILPALFCYLNIRRKEEKHKPTT